VTITEDTVATNVSGAMMLVNQKPKIIGLFLIYIGPHLIVHFVVVVIIIVIAVKAGVALFAIFLSALELYTCISLSKVFSKYYSITVAHTHPAGNNNKNKLSLGNRLATLYYFFYSQIFRLWAASTNTECLKAFFICLQCSKYTTNSHF